jgi:glycosyltransferase involved in cell wall biosynthesis
LKIEIFIPAYNCQKTLTKTLASLVAQTDQNFSVCVVDDLSSENLSKICS